MIDEGGRGGGVFASDSRGFLTDGMNARIHTNYLNERSLQYSGVSPLLLFNNPPFRLLVALPIKTTTTTVSIPRITGTSRIYIYY